MSCSAPTITVGGVTISTSDFENAKELLKVSGDQGDPTLDGYDENIANGNNTNNRNGVQFPPSEQTTPPAPIPEEAQKTDDKKAPDKQGEPVTCTAWAGDYDFQLSPNYTVKDLTVGALFPNQLIDVPGFTASQRCCNLQALAVNILEPMKAKFGNLRINSAIRNQNTTSGGTSQHVKGEAVDIQFEGWTYDMYWNNAAWVRDNIPFDQFIFEHSSSTGLAWYHLSYNQSGNRPSSSPTKVMTMYRNNYSPGLKRYG